MATIKEETDSYTTTRDLSIDIHWDESHYPGDDGCYDCSITFPVPHLTGETVKLDYSSGYQSDIIKKITQDIAAYLDDPQDWTEEIIKKGVEPVLSLRQMESELAETRTDRERYSRYAEQEAEKIQCLEQRIAAHKAKYEL